MAFHGPSYGILAQILIKRDGQYDQALELELDLQAWIESVLGHEFPANTTFHQALRDGIYLCNLLNKLKPNSCKPPKIPKPGQLGSFVMMENINQFLQALDELGFNPLDKFVTVDLYEAKNMLQVVQCLDSLRYKFHTNTNKN